jgi:hypothetical protein
MVIEDRQRAHLRLPNWTGALKTMPLFSIILLMCSVACMAQPVAPLASSSSAAQSTTLPTLTPVPTPMPGGLYVDAAQDLGPISPLVYGSNYGPWLFVPLEMRPQAVDARLSYLRFPGGNWGDQNDLDEWQVDQFIALCKELGSEPSISVRLKGSTPEKAAALVKYVNVTKGYHVRYWAIGNEPSLYGDDYDTVRYNQEWRVWADAIRAVDPTIKLIGPETHQFMANLAMNPQDSAGRDWMTEFLKANGDLVDIVAFHRYPFPTSGDGVPPTIGDLRANTREWDAIIPALRALIREYAGRDLPVAVTEVNSSWAANSGGEATMDSFYNAIWWGDSLGRMIRQNVDIVAQFALVGEYGLMSKHDVYPIYYVYRLYQQLGTQRLYVSSDSPDVSLFAAKRADGTLTLMVVNLGDQATTLPVTLQHFTPGGQAEVVLFDDTHAAETMPPVNVATAFEHEFPPASMTLLTIPGK